MHSVYRTSASPMSPGFAHISTPEGQIQRLKEKLASQTDFIKREGNRNNYHLDFLKSKHKQELDAAKRLSEQALCDYLTERDLNTQLKAQLEEAQSKIASLQGKIAEQSPKSADNPEPGPEAA